MRSPVTAMSEDRVPQIDFDVYEHSSMAGSDEAWNALRAKCPVSWSARNLGHWTIAGYEEAVEAFRDWETFSSERTDPAIASVTGTESRQPLMLPEESDPPRWRGLRQVLAELLSPRMSERLQPRVTHWVTHSIDRFIESGRAELADDLAVRVPCCVTMEWLGWPQDEWVEAASCFHDIIKEPGGSPGYYEAHRKFEWLSERVHEEVSARRLHPRDDVLSVIANYEIDGELLPLDVAESIVVLTIGGGTDTTTSVTSAAIVHLGRNPEDKERLRTHPELIDSATEEFLRLYSPVRIQARIVGRDAEFRGCQLRAGDRVLVSETSANRDERAFPNADRFIMDRFPNRHVAFGAGIHRCPGSHLARLQFKTSINQLMRRLPDFVLDDDGVIEYPNWSFVGGWGAIPVTFTPGPRILSDGG
jgi:cytochrome P450